LSQRPQRQPNPHPYDLARTITAVASSQFRITLDTNHYSVPSRYAHRPVTVKAHPDRVCVYCDNELIALSETWLSAQALRSLACSACSHDLAATCRPSGLALLLKLAAAQRSERSSAPRVSGVRSREPSGIDGDQLEMQGFGDARDNVVLHLQVIRPILIELVGPQMRAALGVDDLRIHADFVATVLLAAFERVANGKLLADLLHVHGLVLVGKCGAARDHEEPRESRKAGSKLLGENIGEVLLRGIPAPVRPAHRPDLLENKSRSVVSAPILS
jgi:hypothetical protein